MKLFHASQSAILLALALALTGAAAPASAQTYPSNYPAGPAFPAPYTDLRSLVDRTQNDLRSAAELESGNDKQRERYRNAQGHLSSFDRRLVKGHFDKGEMDKALGEIKGILDHNVLQASSRDMLMHDAEDLRAARDRRW